MTQNEEDRTRLDAALRSYNTPPDLSAASLEAMWRDVERDAFTSGGRRTFDVGHRSWAVVKVILPIAATLVLGVAIGRYSAKRNSDSADVRRPLSDVRLAQNLPEPYQSTTNQYLAQTAALLVGLPAEGRDRVSDARFVSRAHDLLLTTRLLLDSPAATDPRFRALLEDLELVLAQIARLQAGQPRTDVDLIRQALDQRDVLPRLQAAVANTSADN